MNGSMLLGLDQGTTGTTVLLYDSELRLRGRESRELPQQYPRPGWVEHDPLQIWDSCRIAIEGAFESGGVDAADLAAIGLANQRETVLLWDRRSGDPLHNAIVWQDRRTAPQCERLRAEGRAEAIRLSSGLVPDPYFSATKLAWILDSNPDWRRAAERGDLAAGTVDSWLLWKLTGGAVHATDPTNAARTMLYHLRDGRWDPGLLDLFGIPSSVLPEVLPCSGPRGETHASSGLRAGIPITGAAGDQQAALFGQRCFRAGDAKCTYGTGAFLLQHTGDRPVLTDPHLLATAACPAPGMERAYAIEGSVFSCGATIQWLRDGIGAIQAAAESEILARSVPDNGGVYFVPAFAGLGAPHWDADARGLICGLTRGSTRAHLVRAALESMAYQVHDLVRAVESASGARLARLRVDGGASSNDWLMEFQSGLLDRPIDRAGMIETTALGAILLAGLGAGVWKTVDDLPPPRPAGVVFSAGMTASERAALLDGWSAAIARARTPA